jgi:hypothetical protein
LDGLMLASRLHTAPTSMNAPQARFVVVRVQPVYGATIDLDPRAAT